MLKMPHLHLCLTRWLTSTLMDAPSRNQHSSIEASQIGLFGDSLENGKCDCAMATHDDLEEDLFDGMVVKTTTT